jgi:hypothetical protein
MTRPPAKRAAKRAKPAAKKVHVSESGREAAIQSGTSDREVAEALTGVDALPDKGMELGRPPGRPEFDPHAERVAIEAAMGDDDVDAESPTISTLTFVGNDDGTFEERIKLVIAYAEGKGMINLSASMGSLDPDLYEAIVVINGP